MRLCQKNFLQMSLYDICDLLQNNAGHEGPGGLGNKRGQGLVIVEAG